MSLILPYVYTHVKEELYRQTTVTKKVLWESTYATATFMYYSIEYSSWIRCWCGFSIVSLRGVFDHAHPCCVFLCPSHIHLGTMDERAVVSPQTTTQQKPHNTNNSQQCHKKQFYRPLLLIIEHCPCRLYHNITDRNINHELLRTSLPNATPRTWFQLWKRPPATPFAGLFWLWQVQQHVFF